MAKTYAITGGATGIGAALKEKLCARGDRVFVVDLHDADINADLSTTEGRESAIEGIKEMAPEGLDGFIPCAGVSPVAKPLSLMSQVNFFGSTVLIEGLVDLVAKKKGAIVAVGSLNATLPGLDEEYIQTLLLGDEEKSLALVEKLDDHSAYGGAKNALIRWVRRKSSEFMRSGGVRMNVVVPGFTETPMADKVMDGLSEKDFAATMLDFKKVNPSGKTATPEMIADTILFMLDPASRYVSGAVLFVDCGQDAQMRPDQF